MLDTAPRLLARLALALALLTPLAGAQVLTRTVTGTECRIKTDLGEEEARALAADIDAACLQFAAFYESLGFQARNKNELVLRIFTNLDDFQEFNSRDDTTDNLGGATMYGSEELHAIVAHYPPQGRSLRKNLIGICSLMYLRRYTTVAPVWLKKGLEAHFLGYEYENGRPVRPGIPMLNALVLVEALKKDDYIGLSDLVKRDQARFNDRPPKGTRAHNLLPIAESWGLFHYLFELAPEGERKMFRRYLKQLNAKGARADQAKLDIANWKEFEGRWKTAMLAIDAGCDKAADYMEAGEGHLEVFEYAAAAESFQTAYKLDKKLPGIFYKTGSALKSKGDYAGAVPWLERASAMDPADPSPDFILARLYSGFDAKKATPEPAKAVLHAQRCVDRAPDRPVYLAFLARCQQLNGDPKAALETMRKAVEIADQDDKAIYEAQLADLQKRR